MVFKEGLLIRDETCCTVMSNPKMIVTERLIYFSAW